MMMPVLTFVTCRRLKEVGFPQGEDVVGMFWYRAEEWYDDISTPNVTEYPDEFKDPCDDEIIAACPNSDELIAEIMTLKSGIDYQIELGSDFGADSYWKATVNGMGITYTGWGALPEEALAALYIAIKESE